MNKHEQIQHYKTSSQTAAAAARQFNDYLNHAAIYNFMPENKIRNQRQVVYALQESCARMEAHIRENLNKLALQAVKNAKHTYNSGAMIVLEKELVPQFAETEQQLLEEIDYFLLYMCKELGKDTLRDINILQRTLRLRRRIGGSPTEEQFAAMAKAAGQPYGNLISLLYGSKGH